MSNDNLNTRIVYPAPASAPVIGLSQALLSNSLLEPNNATTGTTTTSTSIDALAMNDRPALRIDVPSSSKVRPGSLRYPGELGIDVANSFATNLNEKSEHRLINDAIQSRNDALLPQSTGNNRKDDNNVDDDDHHMMNERYKAHYIDSSRNRQRINHGAQCGRNVEAALHTKLESLITNHGSEESCYSCVASFCYNGNEILIGSTTAPTVYLMNARTRYVLQILDMPSIKPSTSKIDSSKNSVNNKVHVISIQSNNTTGQVAIVLSSGIIHTYVPYASNPMEISFGRYHWKNSVHIDSTLVFTRTYHAATETIDSKFVPCSSHVQSGEKLDVSLSRDGKILVAHLDQLAVFDGGNFNIRNKRIYDSSNTETTETKPELAELLWTTQLPGNVVAAKISGDAYSIAIIIERSSPSMSDDSSDNDDGNGVHVFERDWDDGSSQMFSCDSTIPTTAASSQAPPARLRSSGILYKPGPFLVHSALVNRISFRGLGHLTSSFNPNHKDTRGCDLLLTYCPSDCSARIYEQNAWNMLTEWSTLPNSRVDWVKGISSFTIGDLGSNKKSKRQQWMMESNTTLEGTKYVSGTVSPPSSGNSMGEFLDDSSTATRTVPTQPLHHHSVQSSNAGAWLSEITFTGKYPAIRFSRLTYFKRGVDDWNPTLLESLSSYLPYGCAFPSTVLDTDESCVCVEAVWPAWNPALSDSPNLTTTKDDNHDPNQHIRGSAMAYLGLLSGSSGSGGTDSVFGGSQHPPSEIRLTMPYPTTGNIVQLEFSVFCNRRHSSIELGSPIRSILSLKSLDETFFPILNPPSTDTKRNHRNVRNICSSMDYDGNRIIAELGSEQDSISLMYNQRGTMSLLPASWTSNDLNEERTANLFKSMETIVDGSVLSVPLMLPPLYLPREYHNDNIVSMLWWSDSHCDGCPFLVSMLESGTIVVFAVPPVWSVFELQMPTNDKPPPTTILLDMDNSIIDKRSDKRVYDVLLTPDSEFGLGLRLESHLNGVSAIVGSLKKHPITGDLLPAEQTGLIGIGDQLLSVNGIDLENELFDSIIDAVREAGSVSNLNEPMRLTFRCATKPIDGPKFVTRTHSVSHQNSFDSESSRKRRSMEQIIGIKTDNVRSEKGKVDLTVNNGYHSELSTVVSLFQNLISSRGSKVLLQLRPLVIDGKLTNTAFVRYCIVFVVENKLLRLIVLAVATDTKSSKAIEIGTYDLSSALSEPTTLNVCSMTVVEIRQFSYELVLCHDSGEISVVRLTCHCNSMPHEMTSTFYAYPLFQLPQPVCNDLVVKAVSSNLLATMQNTREGASPQQITIWYSTFGPDHFESTGRGDPTKTSVPVFASFPLYVDDVDAEAFLNFEFVTNGFLDTYPSLVTYSDKGANLFVVSKGSNEWCPSINIAYPTIGFSSSQLNACCELRCKLRHPLDTFPHLVASMCTVYKSLEESTLRSDWHPEVVLSHLCSDARGIQAAVKSRLTYIFQWICSEGINISHEHLGNSLVVCPLPILDDQNEMIHSEKTLNINGSQLSTSEKTQIRQLQTTIATSLSSATIRNTPSISSSFSFEFNGSEIERDNDADLPPFLRSFDHVDLQLLWALGELLLDQPSFETIDDPGQVFVFAEAIFRKITESPQRPTVIARPTIAHSPSFLLKRTAPAINTTAVCVSSAGVLAALVSKSQVQIMTGLRRPGEKLSWGRVSELRIPFWERSDTALAKLAEEVGQSLFRETRDIMECAIFFLIARKRAMLKNLAATDQSTTGRTFYKFLNTHDFASTRGRQAAEKNAFSLLRKNRHRVAAAFFLLPNPPQLKSCLETIATKMEDLSLAVLVARLMESAELPSLQETDGNVPGSMSGFGINNWGGGGGYATTMNNVSHASVRESAFEDWEPKIGRETKVLLYDRILPSVLDDKALSAVVMLWLRHKEEAYWTLAGTVDTFYGSKNVFELTNMLYPIHYKKLLEFDNASKRHRNANEKANIVLDITIAPNILQWIHAEVRVCQASCLLVASALRSRGAELAALHYIKKFSKYFEGSSEHFPNQQDDKGVSCELKSSVDRTNGDDTESQNEGIGNLQVQAQVLHPSKPVPSIFDDFDVYQPRPPTASNHTTTNAESSIFDKNDLQPKLSGENGEKSRINGVSSGNSMLGGGDARSATTAVDKCNTYSQPPSSTQVHSSIFDTFDARPTVEVSSSIFDNYDVPEQHPSSDRPQHSIFDAFDARSTSQNLSSGTKQPSIFDIYDVPLHKPPSLGGQKSICEDFDNPTSDKSNSSAITTAIANNSVLVDVVCEDIVRDIDTHSFKVQEDLEVDMNLPFRVLQGPPPMQWGFIKDIIFRSLAARRLCREVVSVLAPFHGDIDDISIDGFYISTDVLVSPKAAEALQLPCDSEKILGRVRQSFEELCEFTLLEPSVILHEAEHCLGSDTGRRLLVSVVLHSAVGKCCYAEEIIRRMSNELIGHCRSFGTAMEAQTFRRKSRSYVSSQFVRRLVARLSWQLELCLWLHRGGGLPLSGVTLNEAVIAVRVGFLVAGWNRNFKCLDCLVSSAPDCVTNVDIGRHLWTSMKVIEDARITNGNTATSSGGWEFLVDCKRSQAADLLRSKPTGTFIIRPHPQDTGVFTISFKTNLVPTIATNSDIGEADVQAVDDDGVNSETGKVTRPKKQVRKDDVVQHAIIRLSDTGFRCGSFGPFTSLMSLLEAVSASLPFKLRFDLPPKSRVIVEEGRQPSPNAVFLRRFFLRKMSKSSFLQSRNSSGTEVTNFDDTIKSQSPAFATEKKCLSLFTELMVISLLNRQFSGVAAAEHTDFYYREDLTDGTTANDAIAYARANRILRPFLHWYRSLEIFAVHILAPGLENVAADRNHSLCASVTQSQEAIEVSHVNEGALNGSGDSIIRRMIQPSSGVDFSTLRLTEGGDCTMVVLFSKEKAVQWLVSNGREQSEADALAWLILMEEKRVIEPVDLAKLPNRGKGALDTGVRYRFVDPWEVEAVQTRDGETQAASIGRERFMGFSVTNIRSSTEETLRSLGGTPLLELWATVSGSTYLTKALASVNPPWERDSGGDIFIKDKIIAEPPPFLGSIRQCLYRNSLFRRLEKPQRFLALVQVELLDLKNLTTPGGSLALTAYALLRLKRPGSGSLLTNKARTLDSMATVPTRLNKTSGPNAPASWGSVVRFRFPLPEDVAVDGMSYDKDRDALFHGPPTVLQVSVYEKKLLADRALGRADINTDGLCAGGQLEEWVPLRSDKRGIKWFARIRLTLRFDLMCLASAEDCKDNSNFAPSVGLKRISELCHSGGSATEDVQQRTTSSPDLLSYFEGIVYPAD